MRNPTKCRFCRYDRIEHVLLDDILVDKCADCDIVRYFAKDFGTLLRSKIQHKNMLNTRKIDAVSELSDKDRKIYDKFMSYFDFRKWKVVERSKTECNVCGDGLLEIECPAYPDFRVYYCEYCGNVYFYAKDLDEAMNELMDEAILSSKWYGFIFKIFRSH